MSTAAPFTLDADHLTFRESVRTLARSRYADSMLERSQSDKFPIAEFAELGAAGLLRGYRAATHWTAMEFLSAFGAVPTRTRVCVDRNRITGGGVTAGIDFALTLVSLLIDRPTAELIQLRLEYNPAPPFDSGSPDTAPPEILSLMKEKIAPNQQRRGEAIARAGARLAPAYPSTA